MLNKGKVDERDKHKYTLNKWKKKTQTQTHAEDRAGSLAVKGKVDEGDKHRHQWKKHKCKHT